MLISFCRPNIIAIDREDRYPTRINFRILWYIILYAQKRQTYSLLIITEYVKLNAIIRATYVMLYRAEISMFFTRLPIFEHSTTLISYSPCLMNSKVDPYETTVIWRPLHSWTAFKCTRKERQNGTKLVLKVPSRKHCRWDDEAITKTSKPCSAMHTRLCRPPGGKRPVCKLRLLPWLCF